MDNLLQINGLTECFNQTLTKYLAKIADDTHTDWDVKIDTVLMGYRASRQVSMKHSPYFMPFQQHMRLPIDNEVLSPLDSLEDEAEEGLD